MISFGITPFTDLPAHRIIRYFAREPSNKEEEEEEEEEHVAVHSGLSHLWSERRRHEEDRFATLMADLVAIAKELDVVVVSGADDSKRHSTQTAKNDSEDECRGRDLNCQVYRSLDNTTPVPEAIAGADSYSEEIQDAVWLNDMEVKVQTLLLDAHQVLGTRRMLPVPSNTSESLFNMNDPGDNHSGEICHSLSFDVISLYARDSSFTSEGPTLLEGDQDSSMATSKSDSDSWLLSDTSTDTATDTSFSLDQYLEVEGHLTERIFDDDDLGFISEKAIIHIPVKEQARTRIQET